MHGWSRILSISVVVLLAIAQRDPVVARTWVIHADGSGDAPTIQAGIDSAAVADTVLVAAGLYHENLLMAKQLTLRGEAGAAQTTIDGGFRARVLGMTSGIVEGLTLRRGLDAIAGGGLLIGGDATTVIRNTIIEDNIAGATPKSGAGGGMYISQSSGSVLVESNVIRNNTAGVEGGGIKDDGGSPPNIIRRNLIDNNRAGQGGGVATTNGSLESNVITRNRAATVGAGILGGVDGWPTIQNNTVIGNRTTTGTAPHGAGIQVYSSVALMASVRYNLVVDNHGAANNGAGIFASGASVEISNNDTWQNDIDDVGRPTNFGNFSQDPQFCAVDPVSTSNADLQSDSPCAPGNRGPGSLLVGARGVGCGIVGVASSTWTSAKQRFR